MKLEARNDRVTLSLQSNDVETHALLTNHRAAVEATLKRASDWFAQEVARLHFVGAVEALVGWPASTLQEFGDDPLAEFQPEAPGPLMGFTCSSCGGRTTVNRREIPKHCPGCGAKL